MSTTFDAAVTGKQWLTRIACLFMMVMFTAVVKSMFRNKIVCHDFIKLGKGILRVIFFDIDDTLFDNTGAEIKAAKRYYQEFPELHVHGGEDEFIQRWRQTTEIYLQLFIERRISFQEQRRKRLRDIFRRPLNDREADTLFNIYLNHYEKSWQLFEDVTPCLDRLEAFRLGVITNGNTRQQCQKLRDLGIMDRFEIVLVSQAIGISKPEKEIFLHACKTAAEKPQDCLYIGDKLDVDAHAAQKAGLKGIWLNRRNLKAATAGISEINGLNELHSAFIR